MIFTQIVYNTEFNDISWATKGKRRKLNKRTGVLTNKGYLRTKINKKSYPNHWLVWALHNNNILPKYPLEEIDHIDGNRINNNISNLRLVSKRENCNNLKCHREGKLPGCSFNKSINLWVSRISLNNKVKLLGYFKTKEEAHNKYAEFKKGLIQ